MLARDLAEAYPTVGVDDDAIEAARLLARDRLPGLLVTDSDGRPYAVLPPSQVLRFVIPEYIQQDPSLARVLDEKASDRLVNELSGRSVRDILPEKPRKLPVLKGEDTTLEIAAEMAQRHCPITAIVEGDRILGVVTVWRLLELGLHRE